MKVNSTDILTQINKRYEDLATIGYDKSSFSAGFYEGYGFAHKKESVSDFKARLVIEYKDIKERTNKLIDFLRVYTNSNKMSVEDWNLLIVQKDIMISYVSILELRLSKLDMDDVLED